MPAIEIKQLTKIYNQSLKALDNISITIETGGFFALLGPNGAGKSTTINIISSLLKPSSGSVSINGHDIQTQATKAKQQLGIVPQEFNFSIFETCEQIVINQAGYYGVPKEEALRRSAELFKQLGLWEKRKTSSSRLSGGMKRRLMIARALIHNPKILILDEPTAGVDIALRRSMWDFLKEKNKQGLTIVLTTHYLEEAEQLCKRIAIIDKGKIIENTTMQTLLSKLDAETLCLECDKIPNFPESFPFKILATEEFTIDVELPKTQTVTDLVKAFDDLGVSITRLSNKTNRLEELFLSITEPL
jgi:ABC-2 type transport system ATP-binding protein